MRIQSNNPFLVSARPLTGSNTRWIPATIAAACMLLALDSPAALAQPVITEPVVAIVNNPAYPNNEPDFVAIAINGSGFGSAVSTSKVKVRDLVYNPGLTSSYGATDSEVVLWSDTRIVVKSTYHRKHPIVWIKIGNDYETEPVIAERYSYNYFGTNSGDAYSSASNPSPFALATHDSSWVYLNEQWQSDLKRWGASSGSVGKIAPASPDTLNCPGGCFAMQIWGTDIRTHTSTIGESVAVDRDGTAWLTQGGAPGYTGTQPNHSRIVSRTAAGVFKVYNIPGDDQEISGLAWDEANERIWFSQRARKRCVGWTCATAQPAKIVSFKPSEITEDNNFDFVGATTGTNCDGGSLSPTPTVGTCSNDSSRSCFTAHDCVLVSEVCDSGDMTSDDCYREYPVSGIYQIAQVAVTRDGSAVWFSNYWGGSSIGRLDVDTGTQTIYPVHYTTPTVFAYGPRDIEVTGNGDVIYSHPARHTVGRLDVRRADEAACLSLTSTSTNCTSSPNTTCANPCIEERTPAGFTSVSQSVHSLAEGPDGRVWFDQGGLVSNNAYASSIGFWKGDRTGLVLFPSPQLYPAGSSTCAITGGTFGGFSGADLVVNDATGDVWFGDYCRKRIGRLHREGEEICEE